MIEWLVEDLDADPTYENGDLFLYAAEYGWTDVMKLFIETAGPDAFDYDEALHCALLGIVKHPDMDSNDLKHYPSKIKAVTIAVRYLIALGADPNHNQNGALKIAVKNNQPEIVQLLLDAGAKEKDIPLLIASNLGHIEIVKLLLKAGADPMYGNGIAIEKALQNGHEKIVKLLLANVERRKAFDTKVDNPKSLNNPTEENTVIQAFETISLEENKVKEA
jgi:ankyrin repeat protein